MPTFESLMNQFDEANYVPRVAVLYHGGEPFLNNKLTTFIRMLKERGSAIKFNSNASLLTKEIGRNLVHCLDERDMIEFSFDGNSIEENNYIRTHGDFIRDSQHVIDMAEMMKEQGCGARVTISNVQILSSKEIHQFEAAPPSPNVPAYIVERFKGYPFNLQSFHALVWPSYRKDKSPYDTTIMCAKEHTSPICLTAHETITVLSNGDVVPCCYDINGETILGNIHNNSIFDIWESDRYTGFRERLKRNDPVEFCKRCTFYSKEYLLMRPL